MKTINPETAVIVFDLDDTLYSEYEYKLSGIRAIVDTVATLYPDWDSDDLWRSIDPDGKDWLDKLCRHCGFTNRKTGSSVAIPAAPPDADAVCPA